MPARHPLNTARTAKLAACGTSMEPMQTAGTCGSSDLTRRAPTLLIVAAIPGLPTTRFGNSPLVAMTTSTPPRNARLASRRKVNSAAWCDRDH